MVSAHRITHPNLGYYNSVATRSMFNSTSQQLIDDINISGSNIRFYDFSVSESNTDYFTVSESNSDYFTVSESNSD